jgi:hypothetical protein
MITPHDRIIPKSGCRRAQTGPVPRAWQAYGLSLYDEDPEGQNIQCKDHDAFEADITDPVFHAIFAITGR